MRKKEKGKKSEKELFYFNGSRLSNRNFSAKNVDFHVK